MTQWYYSDYQHNRQGPVNGDDLAALHASGQLTPGTLVWREGMSQWQPWRTVMGEVVPGAGRPAMAEATFATAASDAPAHATANPYTVAEPRSPYAPPSAPLRSDAGGGIHRGAEVVYAGFWKRVAANFIDSLLVGVIGAMVGGTLGAILGASMGLGFATPGSSGYWTFQGIFQAIGIAIAATYYGWFHSSSSQATPGKMAIGIKVVRGDGERISLGRGIGRYFAMIPSGLILGIGFLMAGFTERKQALHDLICDTLVVDKWAFTDRPEWQRHELGTLTVVILVAVGLLFLGFIAFMAVIIGLAARGGFDGGH
jgi:uncharacterized RDD family membrane protein YckC